MNKFYQLIIVLIPFGIIAQPVIDNTWQPSVGDSYSYNEVSEPFDFPTTGTNQTWDYSNLNLGAISTINFIDPSSTPFAADFPNSNIVVHDVNSSVYFYFETSQTQFLDWGRSINQPDVVYSDPLIYMPFPFTYGDYLTDNATGTLNGGSGTRTKSTELEGYGYGDLILPESTLNNILCVKLLQNTINDYGGGMIDTTSLKSYLFLSTNETYTVFWLSEFIYDNDSIRFGYVKSNYVGLNDEYVTNNIKTTIYPNPINQGEEINVSILIDKNQTVDVEIIDITGKAIKNIGSKLLTTGTNDLTVESDDLDSGIYFVKTSTIDSGYSSTSKVIIK